MKQLKFTPDLLTGRLKEEDAKRYFSRFGWFAFAFIMIVNASSVFLSMLVYMIAPQLSSNFLILELLSIVPIYGIAFPIAYRILAPLPTVTPVTEKMRTRAFLCAFCICEAMMLLGNYISNIVISIFGNMLGGISPSNPLESTISAQPMWATILFVAIVAPILEELFFRRMVLKKLLVLGEGYAIVLSSAFFALCHGNFFQLFYAFIIGCFFGFIYVKTGKLLYTTLLHILVNFLGSVVVTWVTDFSHMEQFLENPVIDSENLLRVMTFILYELVILFVAIFGMVMLFKSIKKIKFDGGLLPPPKGSRGVSALFMNSGVAAAIAIFALTLVGSLFI